MLLDLSAPLGVLVAGFLLEFTSAMGTYFISLFAGEIRAALALSDGQWGGIYTIDTYGPDHVVWPCVTDRFGYARLSFWVDGRVCGGLSGDGCVRTGSRVFVIYCVVDGIGIDVQMSACMSVGSRPRGGRPCPLSSMGFCGV